MNQLFHLLNVGGNLDGDTADVLMALGQTPELEIETIGCRHGREVWIV
jgi:hypothetical protein